MLTGLQTILEKEVVLSTINADDLLNNPLKVESDYQKHVQTFIPMGDVSDFSTRLVKYTIAAKTPKGLIVAPYGYGKTSTLAFLWHECEQQNLVAIPPFYCANLLDILKATYGWVKFQLQKREPALLADLEEIYSKYTAATVEDMADRYAREHGLAKVTAINMLNEMLTDGSLVLELTPSNLLFFLDAVANLVGRAGFTGLIVLPDEFQQYFSKGANLRRTVQEFREFIWGLDTRASSLGVIFSVPTYAESVIQEQGKDVLHRLKKDNLYFRLQDIYTLEFPKRLWQRYEETFQLEKNATQVIEPETLRAIGQIAEREDLGEGPRTVIDSFKRAILHFQNSHSAYTPINLIDDFLESNISFQAQANKLKTVTRQALDSAIVDTPQKQNAVKLMAAFPRGCATAVQKQYHLYEAVNALSKAHGELMTHLVEGYTLLGLSRTGGPTHTVDIIVTRFWHSYEPDELHLEAAIRAFNNRLLPRFFERKRGATATGWGELDFAPSARGSYRTLVEGSFNPQYPRRRLALQVAYAEEQLAPFNKEADLELDFLFELGDLDADGKLVIQSERQACFKLNLQQKIGPALPEDLRKLQDFVNPEFVTPLLMLGLVDYFDRWEEFEEQPIPESDQAEIEYFIGRLLDHSVQLLFSRELAISVSPPLRRIGRLLLEELFNRLCRTLFKDYHTFFVHAQYEKVLNDYINAMRDMTLKQRRGHATLTGTKEGLAIRFGLNRVATFDNRIDSEYTHLVEKLEWTGRGDQSTAEIKLTLHPLEAVILRQLRESDDRRSIDGHVVSVLDANKVAEFSRTLGYRDEEILLALQLLAARGYTRFDQDSKIVFLAQVGPDPVELQARLEKLEADLKIAAELLPNNQLNSLNKAISEAKTDFDNASEDEEELDELQTRISDLTQQLSDSLSTHRKELRQQLNALLLDVERVTIHLRSSGTLERKIEGQVAFVMHLSELQQTLAQEQRILSRRYDALKEKLNQALQNAGGGPITEIQQLHQAQQDSVKQRDELEEQQQLVETQIDRLAQWMKLLKDTDQLFNALSRLPDLREQLTRQVVPEIQAHLTKRKLDGLADWELFQAKVKGVEEELESRRRHGNETFTTVKERYEKFLRDMKVDDYRPRSRYTYGEDNESYGDLYTEVREKIDRRLTEIDQDLSRNQTDLLKIQYINIATDEDRALVQRVEQQLSEAGTTLRQLRKGLTPGLIKDGGDDLASFSKDVNMLSQTMTEIRQQLGPILFTDHDLTEEETAVWQSLGSRNDVDLTDLFVQVHRDNPDMTLTDLLTILEKLYRKHRVTIRIRTRG